MFQILIISIILIGLAVAGIAIKMFVLKDGHFTKSCSSVDSGTGEKIGCVCGSDGDETKCVNYEKHHGVLKDA